MECIHNKDLTNIFTVVNGNCFAQLLKEAGVECEEIEFLHNGFTKGFDLCYRGPLDRRDKSNNMLLRCGSQTDFWNKMVKEVNLKGFAGPFKSIPFDTYVQSPVGLVPKHNSSNHNEVNSQGQHKVSTITQINKKQETRLIFNLSWPTRESINNYTPKELCPVKYKDLDKAVQLCLEIMALEANKDKKCYLAKTNIKLAFRHLLIRPEGWRWLVLMARHPVTNEKFYFTNKSLQFGSSISCSHFQWVSNGLEAIFRHRTNLRANNYLDNFCLQHIFSIFVISLLKNSQKFALKSICLLL